MDILAAVIVFLLTEIIRIWPCVWQTKALLLAFLIVLVCLGFFAGPQLGLRDFGKIR